MPTPMTDQSHSSTGTFVTAKYRAGGYDADDEQLFRRLLAPIGPVRLRALRLPEAGGSFEFWLTILFVGKVVAEDHAGSDESAEVRWPLGDSSSSEISFW
jgi:hypothetical protein